MDDLWNTINAKRITTLYIILWLPIKSVSIKQVLDILSPLELFVSLSRIPMNDVISANSKYEIEVK